MTIQSLAPTPSRYLLHASYPIVYLRPQHLISEPTTRASDVDSFMGKFKASVQTIFENFKVCMLEILAEKERMITMASTTNTAGTAATMWAQPEVDVATTTHCKVAQVEAQQKADTMKPIMMADMLFLAVELIESIIVKQQVVMALARD